MTCSQFFYGMPGANFICNGSSPTYPQPPAPAPPAAPQTQEQMTTPGAWTPDQAIAGSVAATMQRYQDFYNQLAGKLPTPAAPKVSTWLYAALAVGAISLFLAGKNS
jgi:hypothetical protein